MAENTLLVDGFHKLADYEGHALDALDLLLGPHEFPLQTSLLILDVLLLQLDVLELPLQPLQRGVLIAALC